MDTKGTVLFCSYILMWSIQGILVHRLETSALAKTVDASQIVLCQDILKLLVSIGLFLGTEGSVFELLHALYKDRFSGAKYTIPAILYAIYNNLTFLGLSIFDPSTYFVLMQFRIVVTGIVHSLIFGMQISLQQWTGLVLVMTGAMMKEAATFQRAIEMGAASFTTSLGLIVIVVQIFLSTTASVVNEKLLKNRMSLSVSNVFMYLISVVVNASAIVYKTGVSGLYLPISSFSILAVVVNGALLGLVTSLFLRYLNSVRKAIASAVEVWVTVLLSWWVFGYAIDDTAAMGISVLSVGVLLFTSGPGQKNRL
jgi:drug/metabolite transporter (DMT)-like permease